MYSLYFCIFVFCIFVFLYFRLKLEKKILLRLEPRIGAFREQGHVEVGLAKAKTIDGMGEKKKKKTLNDTERHRTVPNGTKRHRTPPNATERHRTPPCATVRHRTPPNATKRHKTSPKGTMIRRKSLPVAPFGAPQGKKNIGNKLRFQRRSLGYLGSVGCTSAAPSPAAGVASGDAGLRETRFVRRELGLFWSYSGMYYSVMYYSGM